MDAASSHSHAEQDRPGTIGGARVEPVSFTARKGVSAKRIAKLHPEMVKLAQSGFGGDAEALVDAAKNPESSAHDCFEWDDAIAGNEHRLWQARNYWGAVRIEFDDGKGGRHSAPAFIPIKVRTEDGERRGYRDVRDVVRNENWNAQMLEQAKSELKSFRNRYAMLRGVSDLGDLFDLLDALYPES